jgi:ATP-dependent exoDNAse (exonuclease V) alpha subunit
VAGIITISKGHDASYPWKQIGAAEPGRQARNAQAGAGYYLSPAEKGGEPPGIWTGNGVAELGLRPGGAVSREVFERIYGRHLDPRDPAGQARLGRAPGRYQSADAIHAATLAAEPEATAERRAELMIEAKAQVRTPDLYWDATFSVSKSISLFHASALANAAAAAQRGETDTARRWEEVAGGIWDAVMEGNAAALGYLQREAGQTRAGYHPGGRWEDARQWVIASFRQHTSRDGDPQLHVHNLILHKVLRESDGQWRALDSMSLYRHRPAASAIAAVVMECALTERFGVQWVARRDGHGREIDGAGQALMDMFSSRRASIGPLTARLAQAYQAQFGRAPDARALTSLRQWANHATRRGKDTGALDLAALVRRWSAQASEGEAGALEPLAPAVMAASAAARAAAPGSRPGRAQARPEALTDAQAQRLIQEAVAAVQAAQPTWTEADLIRHLGERLPACTSPMSAQEAAALLPALARQALATEAVLLSAPQWPRVPGCLRRASGESMYVPHGAARYATGAQLTLEERLLTDAAETGAPRLEPATAARLLGAGQAQLEAQLQAQTATAQAISQPTGSGLRLDQAAAAYLVLTSSRRAEVLAGPAGSGKTRTVAQMARIWREAGTGEVIGLATSQTARNVLAEAGVTRAYNTARFLGHLPGRREALGPVQIAPGSLLILDEASMMSVADLAAILAVARIHQCKVVLTGDHEQLAAVHGGGGMLLLARRQGYVQLAEPQRFASAWERDATLRLRAGDVTVLAEYEEHGRLRGGTPDQAMEQAYRGWLADYLAGKDTLLLARTEDQARELCRRARDDLVRYRIVSAGPRLILRAGEQASAGDLVMARRNTRAVRAGHAGRDLANRDVLRVTRTTAGPGGTRAEVVRLTGRDPATGQPRWSAPFAIPRRYLAEQCTLAYATTAHAAQGRTSDTAHVLVDGLGDRQGLYVAMSRGREANYAYCETGTPRASDIREGSRPAPELDRARRLRRERVGLSAAGPAGNQGCGEPPARDPVSVLAAVMARDGGELSATETLQLELSRADHLGTLGAIWDDLARRAQAATFERAMRAALPPTVAAQALDDPACTWLWRTLREAEAAGLDGPDVLRRAVTARSLDGARDVARVLDSRVRNMLAAVQPQLPGAWATRVPDMGSAELQDYMNELATVMSDRARRLGDHAARAQPAWACQALGPVPDDPAARAGWEQRASVVASYRERYGYAHPGDAIGPTPAKTSPEARAAWHAAVASIGQAGGVDLRGCTDGELWLRRGTYQRETSWAPPHVARELRLMRMAERDAHVKAIRAEHEINAASDDQAAARHRQLAATWRALEAKAATEAAMFAEAQDTRRHWEAITETTRRIAIADDIELRRRHPGMRIEPLRPHPAESAGLTYPDHSGDAAEQDAQVQLTLDGSQHLIPDTTPPRQRNRDVPGNQEADGQLILGLTPRDARAEIPEQVARIVQNARIAQAKLDQLTHMPLHGAEEHDMSPGEAWPITAGPDRDAVLQPPKPAVVPSARLLKRQTAQLSASQAEPERD